MIEENSKEHPLIETRIAPGCTVSIVIPVRNEAETLPQMLAAFAAQISFKATNLSSSDFEIIILANNCTDDSAAIIKNFSRNHPELNTHLAEISLERKNSNIGYVRRRLMNEAYRRLKNNKFGGGVIITTDADTRVAPDWIAANLHEIENGADAVGGRIIINEDELAKMDAISRRFHLRDEEYRLLAAFIEHTLDPLPYDANNRHHQHFNASFAVTTEAYEKAGGVPPVQFLEDVAFYNALQRIDARVRHSAEVRVYTSARCVGRCAVGLSNQLNEWRKLGEIGGEFQVESARTIAAKSVLRRLLRELQKRRAEHYRLSFTDVADLAADLGIPAGFLLAEVERSATFGDLYEKVIHEQKRLGEWEKRHRLIPLDSALEEIRRAAAHFKLQSKSAGL